MTSPIPVSPALLRTPLARKTHDEVLARAYETGEAHTRRASTGPAKTLARFSSRFINLGPRPAKAPASSAERDAARQRRLMWGGMNKMPPELRGDYTEGERAALNKIAEQVAKSRRCDMRIAAIAKAVGIKRTTFQNAIRKAARLRHITVEQRPRAGMKSDTNIVRIVSARWLTWMAAGIGFKELNTSEIQESKPLFSVSAEPSQKAYEREKADGGRAKGSEGDCGKSRHERLKREAADMSHLQRALANICRYLGEDEPVRNGHEGSMIDLERGEFACGNPCWTVLPAMMIGPGGGLRLSAGDGDRRREECVGIF